MKSPLSRRAPQSVLAIAVVGGRLVAAHVARSKNAVAVLRAVSTPLSLDLLHPEPELVGREIRGHLDAAQVKERACVVVLPSEWVMTQHGAVPDLSPEDTDSLLQIEAEKAFPSGLDELHIARSSQRAGEGRFATQLAVRREQVARLAEVLRGAGLKPVSCTLGLPALPDTVPASGPGRISLWVEGESATLLVAAGGGIVALRTLEAVIESEAGERVVNTAALLRELRITLEQVPDALRSEVKALSVRGDAAAVGSLAGRLAEWAAEAGLSVDTVASERKVPAEELVEQAGLRFLREGPPALEFLPPRPSRFAQLVARYNSRRLATAGFAAAGLLLIVGGAFEWQQYQLWSLRSDWEGMEVQVKELDGVQAKIREFRPWYDTSFRNLSILRKVVDCFPDNGSVTAKGFEVHSPSTVTVTGTARDNASLLRTLDLLRQSKEVQGLKIEQIRGKTPAQFTFTFRWVGTPGS
jgi:hypothetical protein